jgi:hypothetical protein
MELQIGEEQDFLAMQSSLLSFIDQAKYLLQELKDMCPNPKYSLKYPRPLLVPVLVIM